MARGREGVAKRARERARQEKQEAKRRKRTTSADTVDTISASDETALMEEFRELSERHAAGLVADDQYASERSRIFVELGIETDAD
jgi:hypothetical protein